MFFGKPGIRLCGLFAFYLIVGLIMIQTGPAGQDLFAESNGTDAPRFEDFIIDKIEIRLPPEKDSEKWRGIARNLIYMHEGEPFSDTRFSRSVSALNRSGLFKSIEISDPDWNNPPLTMVFELEPFSRIKNIHISGGFPLLEREITSAMTLHTGDAYIPEKVNEQAGYIKTLYRRQGYIQPEITISCEKDPADGHYVLNVDIEKGPYYEIRRVRTRGNDIFSGKRLLFRLNTWQSSILIGEPTRLIDEKLEEDIETLEQFYWGKAYCEAQVDADVKRDNDRRMARITLNINEGPRYEVKITGNEAFWTCTLKQDLLIYEEGNVNDFNLRRSIRNIEERYKEAGYLDVRIRRIQEMYEENGEPVRSIELAIDEGPRHIVNKVFVSGNEDVSTERIKDEMLTEPPGLIYAGQFVTGTLNADIAAIEALYKQKGYLSTRVESRTETRRPDNGEKHIDVHIDIREGAQTVISDIQIKNLDVFTEQEALAILNVEPGQPHREPRIQESQTNLAAKISEKGYPHVRVETGKTISADETASDLIFRIEEGPYVEMGETFYTGNFVTRPKTLNRQANIEKNEPFSLSDMLESQRNIRNINALETARFKTIGLEEKADRVTLIAEINEKKPYFFQSAIGYDTSRLAYINTGVGTINLLGRNKELRTFVELSMIGYKAEIGYTEPNLFNTGIVADATVFTEEIEEINKNFGLRSNGASLNFTRPLTPAISASLGMLYDYRDQYRTDDTPIAPEDKEQYRSRALLVTTPGLVYDTTDSFVRPTSGVRASASVGVSKGIDNDLDNFLKYRTNLRHYYSPAKRLTLAAQGKLGYIDPYGDKDVIPDDQLFFLGGTMNVRGFSENRLRVDENRDPVGGRTSLMGSFEVRYDLGRNFELAVFYDIGSIRDALKDAGKDEWRSGAGLGLRYHTAIGPIGISHGWKMDRKAEESPGAFHFSIGYTF